MPRAEVQHAELAPAVGEVERDARVADEIDAELGEVRLPAEIGGLGPAGRRTRRDSRARRGAVQRPLLGLEVGRIDERLGARRAELGLREASVVLQRRFDTAKRASADALALRLPPACSCASRRRHMASARRSSAGVTRGGSSSPSTRHRTGTAPPATRKRAGRYTRPDAHRDRRRPRRLPAQAAPRRGAGEVGPRRRRPRHRQHRSRSTTRPFCAAVARAVVRGDAELGIVLGGSGQGEQISANKVHGARAALCNDLYTARMARQHNDANVLSIGARIVAPSSPRRSRRSSSTRRSKAAATSAASTRSPRSNARRSR